MRFRCVPALLCCLLPLMVTGCSWEPHYWHRAGSSQVDYDRDAAECQVIARRLAVESSAGGKEAEPDRYTQVFNDCIMAKGWRSGGQPEKAPPAAPSSGQQPSSAGIALRLNGTTVSALGAEIKLPHSFDLVSDSSSTYGPTQMRHLVWRDSEGTYLNIIFQKNEKTFFEPEPYPVSAPFLAYDRGSEGNGEILWAAFFGELPQGWLVGVGAGVYISKVKRVIVVVTHDLPPPRTPPVSSRLHLGEEQQPIVENFVTRWLAWMRHDIAVSKDFFTNVLKAGKAIQGR